MHIGEMIILVRNKIGMTQTELAKKSGISRSVMNRIELGTRPVRDDELKTISKILGVSADYLLGNDDNKKNIENKPKQPKDLEKFLTNTEIMFDGEVHNLTDDDKALLRNALKMVFDEAKRRNKRKKD